MLTEAHIKKITGGPKPMKLNDGRGLYLLVQTGATGATSKWWRFRYRHLGREGLISLGTYPEIGLAEAREARDRARDLLDLGIDPSQARKEERAAALSGEVAIVPIPMSASQEEKLRRLGGASWVRERIDAARDPKE